MDEYFHPPVKVIQRNPVTSSEVYVLSLAAFSSSKITLERLSGIRASDTLDAVDKLQLKKMSEKCTDFAGYVGIHN